MLNSKPATKRTGKARSQQRVVSQATSAALEYELLSRAIERGYEQIRVATETLTTLQDKQMLRLLEQASQKRRLANAKLTDAR